LFGTGAPRSARRAARGTARGASNESEQCFRVAQTRVGAGAARWH